MREYKYIITEQKKQVFSILLNRPDVHNAMNAEMIAEMTHAFRDADRLEGVRAIVLRGEGKSFCAGADLNYMKEIAAFGLDENYQDGLRLAELFRTIYETSKPTIAVVRGAAFGGANGLLAACDLAIAGENTTFAFSEVKLGIIPATIAPFVIRRIGEFAAKDLMMTGRRFKAPEALSYHLINACLPENEVEEYVSKLISQLHSSAPLAVQETKRLIGFVMREQDSAKVIDRTAHWIAERRASDEGQEGMSSFLEKRKPNWVE